MYKHSILSELTSSMTIVTSIKDYRFRYFIYFIYKKYSRYSSVRCLRKYQQIKNEIKTSGS